MSQLDPNIKEALAAAEHALSLVANHLEHPNHCEYKRGNPCTCGLWELDKSVGQLAAAVWRLGKEDKP